jgi:High-temperature-induced dauer-formation protein
LSSVELPPSSSNNPTWTNSFSFYFSKLYKPADFQMLVDGITRLLRNPIDASKAYLPGSTKKVNVVSTMILLLWTFTESNPRFLSFLCSTDQVLTVLCSIIIESLDARLNPKLVGNLRMSCFLLHVLSQDRNFGIHLNASLDLSSLGHHAKSFPSFTMGCWGDAVYLFIFILLSTSSPSRPAINLLQESYLSTIANIAPLITKFNPSTAQRLFSMFSVYSSPRYLLAKERNHSKLFYLLYAIDTILQYQYHGNVQIVYTIVRNKEKVLALRDMTFDDAVEGLKKAPNVATPGSASPTPLTPQLSGVSMPSLVSRRASTLSDKARGKLPFSSESEIFQPTREWVNILNLYISLMNGNLAFLSKC